MRNDFPIFASEGPWSSLAYLDNAATSQKPRQVLKAISDFETMHNSNVHRSLYRLGEEATELYEDARRRVASFIGAEHAEEIVFVRNTTEALNLVAYCYGKKLGSHDEIAVTELNHHSNLVPWQQIAHDAGATLTVIPLASTMEPDYEAASKIIGPRTKLVAITHKSNVLGSLCNVKLLATLTHRVGGVLVLDAAQSAGHMPLDIRELDCDFLAFSGHKMLGPTGIGVLYGRRELFENMPPFLTGGEMVDQVTAQGATWNRLPYKFEAGTPNVSGAIGLAAAMDYLEAHLLNRIALHVGKLSTMATHRLARIPEVQLLNPGGSASGIVSFVVRNVHPHDVAAILDSDNVAVRAGHHCAQPLHHVLGRRATIRASFYLYNDEDDVDRLVMAVKKAVSVFRMKPQ